MFLEEKKKLKMKSLLAYLRVFFKCFVCNRKKKVKQVWNFRLKSRLGTKIIFLGVRGGGYD